MPRTYIRKTQTKYSKEDLENARLLIEQGSSIYKVSKEKKIPYETLRRWVVQTPKRTGSGRLPILSTEEEHLIVRALCYLAECGFPWDRSDLKSMVKCFIQEAGRPNPFKDNTPGEDWIIGFERRWQGKLSKRKPELLTKARAEGLTENVVDAFFKLYEKVLVENDLLDKPHRIFNLDEAGLGTDPIASRVFVPASSRTAYLKSACGGKSSYSVLFCVSASGWYLPPFIVYKGLHLYQSWTQGGPPGTCYATTKSGWMEDTVFESWFKQFIKSIEHIEKPVLLIYDGHGSHLTYETVKSAMANNIIILCLPPNTSHALQPLDVGVFRPLKQAWKEILKRWFRESRLQKVSKEVFPCLVKQLYEHLPEQNAVSGFRGSGLYPMNKEAVRHRIVSSVKPVEANQPVVPASTMQAEALTPMLQSQPGVSETLQTDTSSKSPFKVLQQAILKTISPRCSPNNLDAISNSKKKRKRVQAKVGEVLTSEDVAARLYHEEKGRKAKKIKGTGITNAHPSQSEEINKATGKIPKETDNLMTEATESIPKEAYNLNVIVGDWVLVKYSGKKITHEFKGLVIETPDEGLYTVKFLTKSQVGPYYVFPEKDDIDDVASKDIVKKLPQPSCNSREQYKFF